MTKKQPLSYRFGIFRLDVLPAKLYRSGKEVYLTRRCFEILMLLVESHGRVVSKGEMLGRIWPDSDVSESNISYHMHALRQILGDSAKNSTMIAPFQALGINSSIGLRWSRMALWVSIVVKSQLLIRIHNSKPER
ncbi:MAG: winged helix-turn-helix domain-containing protein [Blastocatellia bacterium]